MPEHSAEEGLWGYGKGDWTRALKVYGEVSIAGKGLALGGIGGDVRDPCVVEEVYHHL